MRFAAIAALCVCSLGAEPWPMERLFSRPFAWGTTPAKAAWSKHGHVLLFLWNADGRRFMDLYAYHPGEQRLARLTNLESIEDPINRPAARSNIWSQRKVSAISTFRGMARAPRFRITAICTW
jgi:hypothetical protein